MKIQTILDQMELSSVTLPKFQRGYVWTRRSDAVVLEDVECITSAVCPHYLKGL
jgi:hypothetical protein